MSELRPGTGYESLMEVPRAFVDYVNDHARQGSKEIGPSYASSSYDVDLSDTSQSIIESPFDRVLFEDSQYELANPNRAQKDQLSFYLGDDRLMALYHEFGYKLDGSSSGFLLWSGENALRPDEAIVTNILQQLGKLEQAGKMVPTPYQQPEAS